MIRLLVEFTLDAENVYAGEKILDANVKEHDDRLVSYRVSDAVSKIRERYDAVVKQYVEEVIPGGADNSVLETERDTLEWVLSILS